MKKIIPGFDIFKFLLSLGIVAIHTQLAQTLIAANFNSIGGIIIKYESLCVPCFFIISSFLFFRKCWITGFPNSESSYFKFIKRLIIIYFFYFILLSPIIIPNREYLSMGITTGINTFLIDFFMRYTYPGSWFLSALIVSVTIIYWVGRYIKTYWLLPPLLILHIYVFNIDLFPDNWHGLYEYYEEHVRTMQLSFTAALYPICLGSVLSHPRMIDLYKILEYYNKYCLILLMGLFAIYCIMDSILLLTTITILLFVYFYNLDLHFSPVYHRLREYSILFFFWHFIVIQILKIAFHDDIYNVLGIYLFPIVLLIITIIATTILYLEEKKYFRWLRFSH